MADFSSFVSVEIDEAGRPLYLESTVEGDTIASGLFPYNVNHAASAFPTADAHLAALTVSSSELSTAIDNGVAYNDAPLVASAVQLSAAITANDGDIANMVVSASELSAAIDGISVGSYDDSLLQAASGNWNNTSSVVDSASGNWNNVFSDVDSTSATWDLAVVNVANMVVSATDLSAAIDASAAVLAQALSTSDDNFLGGATPTLANHMDANNLDISAIKRLFGKEGQDITLSSGRTIFLRPTKISSVNGNIDMSCNNFVIRQDVGTFDTDSFLTSAANWSQAYAHSTDGSTTHPSGTASGIVVNDGSSVPVSGAGGETIDNPPGLGHYLVMKPAEAKVAWQYPYLTQPGGYGNPILINSDTGTKRINNPSGTMEVGEIEVETMLVAGTTTSHTTNVSTALSAGPGTTVTFDGVTILSSVHTSNSLSAGPGTTNILDGLTILSSVHVSNSLSAEGTTIADTLHVSTALSADATNITVGTCPIPPPWAYSQVNVQNGVNTADPFYHASGCTQGVDESNVNHINWINADCYFSISATGTYEFEFVGTLIATTAACDVALTMQKTTGLGLTETPKSILDTYLAIANKPWPIAMKYTGDVTAGEFFTLKIDGSNNIRQGRGSSFNCRRLA